MSPNLFAGWVPLPEICWGSKDTVELVRTIILKTMRDAACGLLFREFSPGTSGRKTTYGVYMCVILLLGQYYFDTLFPRIPVPVMRQITSNLEKLKLPTKISGSTGDGNRHGSDDTARRPPSVKAALSVSFGQRAPHRAFNQGFISCSLHNTSTLL
ncbi:hypothetical protein NC651_037781 [Populus alba x Populus x berolinensis]|nr:hypothetical protein NC651_037781 [Populus alba x Populus x berolinensis]